MNEIGQVFEGRIVRVESPHLDPGDRGLLYGLGFFETTRVIDHLPVFWRQHCERLLNSCGDFNIAIGPNELPHLAAFERFLSECESPSDVLAVRLNVSAGPEGGKPAIWLRLRHLQPIMTTMNIKIGQRRVAVSDPFARHKSFHYGVRYLAHRDAIDTGFDDALLADDANHLTEAAHANVFVRLQSRWYTPSLAGPILPGTVRKLAIEFATDWDIIERPIPLAELADCEEMFLTNSVRGVMSVGRLEQRTLQVSTDVCELRKRIEAAMITSVASVNSPELV